MTLVETRKQFLAQIMAYGNPGTKDLDVEMYRDRRGLLYRQIDRPTRQIKQMITTHETLAVTACILRSVAGIGPGTGTKLVAEIPILG